MPFHGGFGLLNIHGIAKPAYRAYQLLHQLGSEQLPVDGNHATVDVWVIRGVNKTTVLATNWSLPQHPLENESISISLIHTAFPISVDITRIDTENANAKRVWVAMGEPEYLSGNELQQLNIASELESQPLPFKFKDHSVVLDFTLPQQSIASITLKFTPRGNSLN